MPVDGEARQGDAPPNTADREGYRLEFDEQFDTAVLDEARWLPFYLPHWSGQERARARFSLPGKGLHLHIEQDQQPWLPEIDGQLRTSTLQTGRRSGGVGSSDGQHRFHPDLRVREAQAPLRLYTPRFGFFETRLRAVPIPGYMVALWMIGFEERPEESGEICVCELFGQDLTPDSTVVRSGVHPWRDPSLREEFHVDTYAFDASHFHTYAVDWKPDRLEFFVDDVHVRTIHQSPQYEMQFMLSLYELPTQLTPGAAARPWPRTAVVDYVRGYRPVDGDAVSGRE
ncbi:glycoside hydrolase family 16 protein [Deinococcus pimensis]|uniref:glycoside hydrolase family 16 protein n=1 Tax=Deinococcus pimensis TaxID=309888 RepID=UPI0004B646B4|nr:glycoside hydrolase family 16 protein [Deinococcus pimensis]